MIEPRHGRRVPDRDAPPGTPAVHVFRNPVVGRVAPRQASRHVTLPAMALAQKLATAEFDDSRGCLRVVASAPVPDTDGEVIDPKVLRLDAYRDNPVVIWAHDQQRFPIAKCEDPGGNFTCFVDEQNRLIQDWYFADTAEARYVADLYRQKVLRGASIGFMADGYRRVPAAEAQKLWGVNRDIRLLTGGELLETSAVPIPACPAALALGWIDTAAVPAVMANRSAPPLVTKALRVFFPRQATGPTRIPKTTRAAMSQPTETPVVPKDAADGDPKPEGDKPEGEKPEGDNEIKAAFHSVAAKAVGDLFDADHDDKETHAKCIKAIKVAHKGYVNHMKAMEGGQEGSGGDNDDDADDRPEGEKAVEIEVIAPELMEKVAKIDPLAGRVAALESAFATVTVILDGLTK